MCFRRNFLKFPGRINRSFPAIFATAGPSDHGNVGTLGAIRKNRSWQLAISIEIPQTSEIARIRESARLATQIGPVQSCCRVLPLETVSRGFQSLDSLKKRRRL